MSIEGLIRELMDPQKGNAAREELLKGGRSTVEALLSALAQSGEPEWQATIMRMLVEMDDERAADAFRRALDSDDEDIRALGATGLCRLGAEDALEACLRTIDDSPEMLHFEITPAVRALTKMGLPALNAVLPLLDAEDERTRQHAQKVFEQVTLDEIEREMKIAAHSPSATAEWQRLWDGNGAYQWNHAAAERRAAIERWQRWIDRK